ncbi:lipid II-degrading bacteriocin [Azotobacter vinelandii]|uniref:lipid II-degrading bacteriocin n=1 Tax=Azotobacter vinelandii TaxID=354 RepID=UPI002665E4BA|nr:lipid II-degrading bacteriocin [Azotobacter vinelandii]WKN20557.1 lipid II-degrading bacteriocin [Azotobacter vinelandii]
MSDEITLPIIYVHESEDPNLDYSYDSGFPDSPFGEYSYFYDYYIYENGLAADSELKANMTAQNGNPYAYITSMVWLDIKSAMTGKGVNDAFYSEVTPDENNREFSGNATSPFRGFGHYFSGDGEPMNINMDNIDFNIPLETIVDRHSNQSLSEMATAFGVGSHSFSTEFNYDTDNSGVSIGLLLGNITLKIEGVMTVREDGGFSIDGELRSFSDVYDGGAANRGAIKEFMTNFIQGGTPYRIDINGSKEINFDTGNPSDTDGNIINPSAPSSTINGSGDGFDTLFNYFEKMDDIVIVRTGDTSSIMIKDDATVYMNDIDRVVFEDNYIDIAELPIIDMIGNAPIVMEA